MKRKAFQKSILKIGFWVLGMGAILPETIAQTPKLTLDLTKPGADVKVFVSKLL